MPITFPTPCTNCLDSYICPDGVVDVRCIKYESGTLADYLQLVVAQLTGISWTEQVTECDVPITFTHNFNLTDFERIIVQVVRETDGTIEPDVILTNYTANSVDVLITCTDATFTVVIK